MYTSYSTLSLQQRGDKLPDLKLELLRTLEQRPLVLEDEVAGIMRIDPQIARTLVESLVKSGDVEMQEVRGVTALVPSLRRRA